MSVSDGDKGSDGNERVHGLLDGDGHYLESDMGFKTTGMFMAAGEQREEASDDEAIAGKVDFASMPDEHKKRVHSVKRGELLKTTCVKNVCAEAA